MQSYERTIEVSWADSDPNGHVSHASYYKYGAHARMRFFAEAGFDTEVRNEQGFGPILFKEECSFIKELKTDETIKVNMLKGKMSENGAKWDVHHEIFNEKGEKAAHITAYGAWIDLKLRKLTVPPKAIAEALRELEAGEPYVYKKKGS